ncbi:PKD containing protein [Virus Rctr85]|nr:PKD containing protein [Virus Rctr85]
MGFTDIDNTDLNTAAAAVPAPFGPFTRVGNAADVSPNSHLPVEMTAFAGAKTFFVSYDTLSSADLLQDFIKNTFGIDYLIWQLKLALEVLDANAKDIAPPLATVPEQQEILKSLAIIPTLFGTFPWKALIENDPSLKVVADFTGTPAGANLTLDQTVTGQAYLHLWDFGDGTTSLATDPVKVYAADGTYVVRLIVIGAGGIVEVRKSFVIDVP